MPIQLVPLYVEPAIQAGLDSGGLVQFGGVVRDNSGAIVKHLPKVTDVAVQKAKDLAPHAKALAKRANNPVVLVGAGAAVALGATAVGTAALVDRRKHALERRLNKALTAHVTALQDQNLDAALLNDAATALDKLTAAKPTLTPEDLGLTSLIVSLADFTARLESANPTRTTELEPLDAQTCDLATLRATLARQLALIEPPKQLPPH